MKKRGKKSKLIVYIVLCSVLIVLAFYSFIESENAKVKQLRIIDGDTFELPSGEIVRLRCVDAPEKGDRGYEEAKIYLSELLSNKSLVLEKDSDERDKYGRSLRYVYADKIFVNKALILNGYAKPYPYGNYSEKCQEMAVLE